MQGVEIGNAIDAEDDGLAIDDELLDPILEGGFRDPGYRPVQSYPLRVIRRTRSPLRSTRSR